MDGGGDQKGDEQAEEEIWEPERCGEEGQVEEQGPLWGKQAWMQEGNVVGGKGWTRSEVSLKLEERLPFRREQRNKWSEWRNAEFPK